MPSFNQCVDCVIVKSMLSTSSESPKHVVFENLAAVAQALGHAHRHELLEGLAQGPRSVDDLAGLVGLSMANASSPLPLVRRAGLVGASSGRGRGGDESDRAGRNGGGAG